MSITYPKLPSELPNALKEAACWWAFFGKEAQGFGGAPPGSYFTFTRLPGHVQKMVAERLPQDSVALVWVFQFGNEWVVSTVDGKGQFFEQTRMLESKSVPSAISQALHAKYPALTTRAEARRLVEKSWFSTIALAMLTLVSFGFMVDDALKWEWSWGSFIVSCFFGFYLFMMISSEWWVEPDIMIKERNKVRRLIDALSQQNVVQV